MSPLVVHPTPATQAADVHARALEDVNAIRRERRLPLLRRIVPGRMGVCDDCPIARSISYGTDLLVSVSPVAVFVDGDHQVTPSGIKVFLQWFDEGDLPHLAVLG